MKIWVDQRMRSATAAEAWCGSIPHNFFTRSVRCVGNSELECRLVSVLIHYRAFEIHAEYISQETDFRVGLVVKIKHNTVQCI